VRGGGKKKSRGGKVNDITALSKKDTADKAKKSTSKKLGVTGKPLLSPSKEKASSLMAAYKKISIVTRIYLTLHAVTTLSTLVLGDELSQGLYSLTARTFPFQLYRIITSGSFLGKPSVTVLMSLHYLYTYGSTLEKLYGTSTFLLYLITQFTCLTALALILGIPTFGNSVITSMLHILSRQDPLSNTKLLIFNVPYWTLPYGLLVVDVLQQQSGSAAVPHVLGILVGHLWYYHKNVWSKVTGVDYLKAPLWMQKRFDEDGELKDKAVRGKRVGKGVKLSDL
jgi:membrane associated rhomboid family serine protease